MLLLKLKTWLEMETIIPALSESELFAGKTRVQQHQMVYQALDGRMGDQLHALALQTKIPK